jgi:hypothetical protein
MMVCPPERNQFLFLGLGFISGEVGMRMHVAIVELTSQVATDLPPKRMLVHLAGHHPAGLPQLPQETCRGSVAERPIRFLHYRLRQSTGGWTTRMRVWRD